MRLRSHSTRPAAIAAVIGSCVLLASGGVAYSALASGKAPNPKPGTYSGFADVDTVSFEVSPHGSITGLSSSFNPASFCGVPTSAEHERFPSLQVKNGHFSGSTTTGGGSGGTVTHFSVQGKFVTPTRATGKINGHFTVRSLPPCHASTTFSAKRKGK